MHLESKVRRVFHSTNTYRLYRPTVPSREALLHNAVPESYPIWPEASHAPRSDSQSSGSSVQGADHCKSPRARICGSRDPPSSPRPAPKWRAAPRQRLPVHHSEHLGPRVLPQVAQEHREGQEGEAYGSRRGCHRGSSRDIGTVGRLRGSVWQIDQVVGSVLVHAQNEREEAKTRGLGRRSCPRGLKAS